MKYTWKRWTKHTATAFFLTIHTVYLEQRVILLPIQKLKVLDYNLCPLKYQQNLFHWVGINHTMFQALFFISPSSCPPSKTQHKQLPNHQSLLHTNYLSTHQFLTTFESRTSISFFDINSRCQSVVAIGSKRLTTHCLNFNCIHCWFEVEIINLLLITGTQY